MLYLKTEYVTTAKENFQCGDFSLSAESSLHAWNFWISKVYSQCDYSSSQGCDPVRGVKGQSNLVLFPTVEQG
jgi:hypothetical protein